MDPPPPPWEAAPPSSAGPSTLPTLASPQRLDDSISMPPPPTSWDNSASSSVNPSPSGPPRLKVKISGLPQRTTSMRGVGRGRGRGRGGGGVMRGGRTSTRISAMAEQAGKVKKIKFSVKGAATGGEGGGGRSTSFLGDYDRELDDDIEEPLHFEEQFILRVPKEVAEGKGEGTGTGLREMIKGKGKGLEGIEFKFIDSRRAAFKINGVTYSSKLVDLPNIIESQKTFDNRHLFKVADISQMLVVDKPIPSESAMPASLHADDYIWPHGITPPLRHVRKRRFRKRISRRAIEVVEEQVEELLKKDQEAEESVFDAHTDADIPDSYYIDYDPERAWRHASRGGSEFAESEMYEDPGSTQPADSPWPDGEGEWGEGEGGEDDGEGEEDGEGDYDEELAAALMEQMEARSDDQSGSEDGLYGSDDEDDEGEGEGSGDEEDEETTEKKAKIKQFNSEIKALETAIEKKRAGFTGGNPIMMKRFEETIAGMQADISTKIASRQALMDEIERSKPAAPVAVDMSRKESAKGAQKDRDGDVDMEDGDGDGDAEGEDDDEDTGTGTGTPARREGESPAFTEDGEEDLFGDEEGTDAEGEAETPAETPMGGFTPAPAPPDTPADQYQGEAEGESEEEEGEEVPDEDDEMAALLRAEMGSGDFADDGAAADELGEEALQDMAALLPDVASSPMGTPGNNIMDENTFKALDSMAANMSSPAPYDYSAVEGGVGMRRLAEGVVDDDDDENSSDDSD